MKNLIFLTKSEKLKLQAIKLGLCDEWQRKWSKNHSDQELIDKYIRGLNFCLKHDFPKVQDIKKNFDKKLLHANGIWCDEVVRKISSKMIINGNCFGRLNFKDFDTATIYLRHASKLTVNVKDYARVNVFCRDHCDLTIDNRGFNQCFVYRYGNRVKIHAFGDVIIRDKREDE